LFETATRQNPVIGEEIRNGNTNPLLDYLRTYVFQYGRMYTSEELFSVICGESLNIKYFLNYLFDKYQNIYNL
jgi:carboxypeptidase Taq